MKRFNKLLIPMLLLLASCAATQTRQELNNYKAWFDPLLGTEAKATLLQAFGIPQEKMESDHMELWSYIRNYRISGNVVNYSYTAGVITNTQPIDTRRESFDKVVCAFDEDGKLLWWRVYIQ